MVLYKNICLEGGGIRVIAFCGALKVLDEHGLLSGVKNIIGSSGGALIGTLLAIGYSVSEIEDIVLNLDLTQFQDTGIINTIYNFKRLFTEYGWYSMDKFSKWLGERIGEKTGNNDYTFQQLYDDTGKILTLTGTSMNRRQIHYFQYQSSPDMPIHEAVRISISVPLLFSSRNHLGNIFSDGALLNGYPLWYYDTRDFRENGLLEWESRGHWNEDTDYLSEETIGLYLVGPDDTPGTVNLFAGYDRITSVKGYISSLINSIMTQLDRVHIRRGFWEKTIAINTGSSKVIDFDPSKQERRFLIRNGEAAARKFIRSKQEDTSAEAASAEPETEPETQ